MTFRHKIILAGLLASPAFAQPADQRAQDASNWDIFLKLYPKRALEAKEEGAVGFIVTLGSKGDVTACQVTHSSGHPLLDEETCRLVTMHAQFKPDPSIAPSQARAHEGMIAWKLPQSPTTLASPPAVAASAAPEKMVCRRMVKTGSVASFERICATPSEWAKQWDDMQTLYGELQGKGQTHGN